MYHAASTGIETSPAAFELHALDNFIAAILPFAGSDFENEWNPAGFPDERDALSDNVKYMEADLLQEDLPVRYSLPVA